MRISDWSSDVCSSDLFLNARTSVLQRTNSLPFNVSGSINAGTGMDVGSDGRLGIIATASYGNKWRTRANLQQASIDLSEPAGKSFEQVMTDNQVTVNGLLGVGLEKNGRASGRERGGQTVEI